jgi:protein phosphatase-4 regulatory subunit 3
LTPIVYILLIADQENIKPLITHFVENYRNKIKGITYVDTFQTLILRYDQMQGYNSAMEQALLDHSVDVTVAQENNPRFVKDVQSNPKAILTLNSSSRTVPNGGQRWRGVKEMDAAEEEYFNTSDDEDEATNPTKAPTSANAMTNGALAVGKRLVDYPDDDDDSMDTQEDRAVVEKSKLPDSSAIGQADAPSALPVTPKANILLSQASPPERLSEKRRREEEDEDELGKLSQSKRRSSGPSVGSTGATGGSSVLRRKRTFSSGRDPSAAKKIAISLAIKTGGDSDKHHDEGS